jgi:hypothetical protein
MHHVPLLPSSLLSSSVPIYLLLHVGSILDVLSKIANVAPDLLVWLEREGDNRDEAEGEPFPALHYLLELGLVGRRWRRRVWK